MKKKINFAAVAVIQIERIPFVSFEEEGKKSTFLFSFILVIRMTWVSCVFSTFPAVSQLS